MHDLAELIDKVAWCGLNKCIQLPVNFLNMSINTELDDEVQVVKTDKEDIIL